MASSWNKLLVILTYAAVVGLWVSVLVLLYLGAGDESSQCDD
jgi:hypothetical protein